MITIWELLNSPAGITAIAGGVLFLLNRLYAAKPGWAKWEGTIISAVKFAEQNIPDDTANKGLAKFDDALRHTLRVYEATTKRRASAAVEAQLKEGIQIVHDKLEAAGTLK